MLSKVDRKSQSQVLDITRSSGIDDQSCFEVLETIVAIPCWAVTTILLKLECKMASGKEVMQLGMVSVLECRSGGGVE